MEFKFRNVNDAFRGLVAAVHSGALPTRASPSRVGEVMTVEEPVTITYTHPSERVLFNPARDANPFFHLYEALWMLAGRNDVAGPAYYVGRMRDYSDDGETLNGAYGYRWRHYVQRQPPLDVAAADQLDLLVEHLRRNPYSRRAVLQMWNVEDDLLKIDGTYPCCEAVYRCHRVQDDDTTLCGGWCPEHGATNIASRDVCCNLSAVFQVEPGVCRRCEGFGLANWGKVRLSGARDDDPCPVCNGKPHDAPRYLNMTVFNRSNDMLWGTLGGDYVTFSVLQEYVAWRLSLEVGRYHQVTANLHVYTSRWEPDRWLTCQEARGVHQQYPPTQPLVSDSARFDEEVPRLVERHSSDSMGLHWLEPFLRHTAQPMFVAYHHYKRGQLPDAVGVAESVAAADWRAAAVGWFRRRAERRQVASRQEVTDAFDA